MSLKTRYAIILTLAFVGFAVAFALVPTITGMMIHADPTPQKTCNYNTGYGCCVTYCERYSDYMHGTDLYGTGRWSETYNECWNKYCAKLAKTL